MEILKKTYGNAVITLKPLDGEDITAYQEYSPDGDKPWKRPFNLAESVVRCRLYYQRAKEIQLKCGLELWRAKLNLVHGHWEPYLLRIGISPPTAWRRLKLARQFIEWVKIKALIPKLEEEHVTKAMALIHDKSFNMKDFMHQLEENALDEFSPEHRARYSSKGWQNVFRVSKSMVRVLRKIDKVINRQFIGWPQEAQVEAKNELVVWISLLKVRQIELDKIAPDVKPTVECSP